MTSKAPSKSLLIRSQKLTLWLKWNDLPKSDLVIRRIQLFPSYPSSASAAVTLSCALSAAWKKAKMKRTRTVWWMCRTPLRDPMPAIKAKTKTTIKIKILTWIKSISGLFRKWCSELRETCLTWDEERACTIREMMETIADAKVNASSSTTAAVFAWRISPTVSRLWSLHVSTATMLIACKNGSIITSSAVCDWKNKR